MLEFDALASFTRLMLFLLPTIARILCSLVSRFFVRDAPKRSPPPSARNIPARRIGVFDTNPEAICPRKKNADNRKLHSAPPPNSFKRRDAFLFEDFISSVFGAAFSFFMLSFALP